MNKETWIIIAQITIPATVALVIGIWQIRVMRALATPPQPRPNDDLPGSTVMKHQRARLFLPMTLLLLLASYFVMPTSQAGMSNGSYLLSCQEAFNECLKSDKDSPKEKGLCETAYDNCIEACL